MREGKRKEEALPAVPLNRNVTDQPEQSGKAN
jgi:hypothetical protein